MNRSNFFQTFAENCKPKHFDQPKPKEAPLFDSNALTSQERVMLGFAIRNCFDYGKHLNKKDLTLLINSARKIGLKDLADQMESDLK